MDTNYLLPFSISTIFILLCVNFQNVHSSTCQGKTCSECISVSYNCAWCTQQDFTASRCGTKSELIRAGCNATAIENPPTSTHTVDNEDVRDSNENAKNAIQVQPQLVRITTRPRLRTSIPMAFRAANDYPVDLYFLYDVSVTMSSAIKNLGKLADDIGQAIGDISRDFRMGYGVFQDKTIMPFTDMSEKRLVNPCFMDKGMYCVPPFEFKHRLDMTPDIEQFKYAIDSTNLTANIDHPEGSLDAIMQAVTCRSNLGWREGRKILIFSSNAPFHVAGAGRLAGIITPNDGQCHLDNEGSYTMELKQDYPSVSQVTQAVTNNEMHVIFIVTSDLVDLFQKLSARIPQSIVEQLGDQSDPDNQNIKNVIERKYKEMVSEVEMVHNNITGVDVSIKAISDDCQTKGTSRCKGLEIGKKVDFVVEISVTECPAKPEDRKKKLILHPKSLKSDQLVIELDIICDCDCTTNQATWSETDDVCTNGNGTIKCGICHCNANRFGSNCECDGTELDSLDGACIKKDGNSTLPCSGHGTCNCGQCVCDNGYSGKFCECNDRACKRFNGEVCGGIRGICGCGQCVCEEGYQGSACECPVSNATCVSEGVLCSDSGSCECGVCKCETGYSGAFCQDCFLCGNATCDIQNYKDCAECAFADRSLSTCASMGCPEKTQLVTRLSGLNSCSLVQTDNCLLRYVTVIEDGKMTMYVQETKTCTEPVDIVPIVAGVVGGVVGVGLLLLLLWKILTMAYDRIEYSKFQEDLKSCKWAKEDNPVYKSATTTYKNPMLDTTEPLE